MNKYSVSIVSKSYTADELKNETPVWEDLHYIDISNKEDADKYMEGILDEPLKAPNGYHKMSGTLRDLYGQEHINRVVEEILNSEIQCGLIFYVTVRELKDTEIVVIDLAVIATN